MCISSRVPSFCFLIRLLSFFLITNCPVFLNFCLVSPCLITSRIKMLFVSPLFLFSFCLGVVVVDNDFILFLKMVFQYVDMAGLEGTMQARPELTETLPLPLECWHYSLVSPPLACSLYFRIRTPFIA